MRKNYFLIFVLVSFCLSIVGGDTILNGGESAKSLQVLHREIGSKLVKIKKDHPKTQPVVYSVLDKLGKYHSVSKKILEKKNKYKKLFGEEIRTSENMKEKVTKLESRIEKMKKLILEASEKLKKDSLTFAELQDRKDSFTKDKEKFKEEKERFEFEKKQILAERDALMRERDALVREKEFWEKGSGKESGENKTVGHNSKDVFLKKMPFPAKNFSGVSS